MRDNHHVNKLSSSLFPTLRNISRICDLLDTETTKILIHALVMARTDYCNSLLLGASKYNLDKLQWLQNVACRIIYKRRKYDSIPYQIMELHWLKVNERVVFKVVTLMYKCMDGTAPEYLVELVFKEHHCTLWSTNERQLPVSINRLSQVHNSWFSAN